MNENWYGRVQNARRIAQRYIDNIDARLNRNGISYTGRENLKAPRYAYMYGRRTYMGLNQG